MIGPDWGEQLGVYPNGEGWRFTSSLVVVNYTQQEIITTWQPLIDWLEKDIRFLLRSLKNTNYFDYT